MFVNLLIVISNFNSTVSDICIIGTACDTVQSSVYGKFMGESVAKLGLVAFVIYFMMFFWFYKSKVYIIPTILGAAVALYFLYVQFFVLHQLCSNCIIIEVAMLIATVIYFVDRPFFMKVSVL